MQQTTLKLSAGLKHDNAFVFVLVMNDDEFRIIG